MKLPTRQQRRSRARVPREQRLALCKSYGVTYSPRQWVKLKKKLRRAVAAATRERR